MTQKTNEPSIGLLQGAEFMAQEFYVRLRAALKNRLCTLVTTEADGRIRTCTIDPPHLDTTGNIWFFATGQAAHVAHIEANPEVCIFCANADRTQWLSLSGAGFVITNLSSKQEMWPRVSAKPAGRQLISGDVVLIRIAIEYAEYWDVHCDRIMRLTKADLVKSRLTSTAPTLKASTSRDSANGNQGDQSRLEHAVSTHAVAATHYDTHLAI